MWLKKLSDMIDKHEHVLIDMRVNTNIQWRVEHSCPVKIVRYYFDLMPREKFIRDDAGHTANMEDAKCVYIAFQYESMRGKNVGDEVINSMDKYLGRKGL